MILEDLRENINEDLILKGVNFSEDDFQKLLSATMSAIDSMLAEEGSVSIGDFGTFTRRPNSITSNFKPSTRLNNRMLRIAQRKIKRG